MANDQILPHYKRAGKKQKKQGVTKKTAREVKRVFLKIFGLAASISILLLIGLITLTSGLTLASIFENIGRDNTNDFIVDEELVDDTPPLVPVLRGNSILPESKSQSIHTGFAGVKLKASDCLTGTFSDNSIIYYVNASAAKRGQNKFLVSGSGLPANKSVSLILAGDEGDSWYLQRDLQNRIQDVVLSGKGKQHLYSMSKFNDFRFVESYKYWDSKCDTGRSVPLFFDAGMNGKILDSLYALRSANQIAELTWNRNIEVFVNLTEGNVFHLSNPVFIAGQRSTLDDWFIERLLSVLGQSRYHVSTSQLSSLPKNDYSTPERALQSEIISGNIDLATTNELVEVVSSWRDGLAKDKQVLNFPGFSKDIRVFKTDTDPGAFQNKNLPVDVMIVTGTSLLDSSWNKDICFYSTVEGAMSNGCYEKNVIGTE